MELVPVVMASVIGVLLVVGVVVLCTSRSKKDVREHKIIQAGVVKIGDKVIELEIRVKVLEDK
jgi:hypothetical protein